MTNSQKLAIEKIRRLADKFYLEERDGYELKSWRVEDCGKFTSVILEYGLIGDEGTLAILARGHAHLFVGKKGGITYPVNKILKNGEYKWYKKTFKGYSILQAVCDQRI